MDQDLRDGGCGWQRFEKIKKRKLFKKNVFFCPPQAKILGVISCKMKGKHVFRRSRGYSGVGTEVMF